MKKCGYIVLVILLLAWYSMPLWVPDSWCDSFAAWCAKGNYDTRYELWNGSPHEWSPEMVKWYIKEFDGNIPGWMEDLVKEYGIEHTIPAH